MTAIDEGAAIEQATSELQAWFGCDGGRARLGGEIDLANADELRDHLLASSAADLEVDCTELAFLDSTGIGVLVHDQLRRDRSGGALRLVNVPAHIQRVLEVAGVADVLTGATGRDAPE